MAMLYVVHWPREGVLKVGITHTMRRVAAFTATGARVILLDRDRPASHERAALAAMAEAFPRAFVRELDSTHLLPRGRGFTECFRVGLADLGHAITTILRGIRRYGNEQAADAAPGHLHGRGPDRVAARRAHHSDRVADARRRPRAGDDDTVDAAGVDLAGAPGGDGGDDRRPPHRPRRCAVPRDLRRRRPLVLHAPGVAFRVAPGAVEASAASSRSVPEAFRSLSRRVLGLGEGERAGEGECGRVARGGPRWNPSVAVLQGASALGNDQRLSPLRDCATRSHAMDQGTQRGRAGTVSTEVTFRLPDPIWAKLAELADAERVKVGEWLADEVEQIVLNASTRRRVRVRRTPKGANPYRSYRPVENEQTRAIIRDRWEREWSMPEIGRHVGMSPQKVGATLWDMEINTRRKAAS